MTKQRRPPVVFQAYFSAGAFVTAKQDFTAVPTDGSRKSVRIGAGTPGIVDEGTIPPVHSGQPTLRFVNFENGPHTVCVSCDPAFLATA